MHKLYIWFAGVTAVFLAFVYEDKTVCDSVGLRVDVQGFYRIHRDQSNRLLQLLLSQRFIFVSTVSFYL